MKFKAVKHRSIRGVAPRVPRFPPDYLLLFEKLAFVFLGTSSGMGNLKLNLSGGPDLRMAGSHFSSISLYPNAIHLMCFSQKSPFPAALL